MVVKEEAGVLTRVLWEWLASAASLVRIIVVRVGTLSLWFLITFMQISCARCR